MSPKTTRILVIILLILGLCLTAFFGFRAFRSFMRFRRMPPQPVSTDVSLIRGWMTIGYLSHAYRVPADYIAKEIGADDPKYHEYTLSQLNQELYPGQPGVVLEKVQAAIQAWWVAHPPPPAPPTAPAAPTLVGATPNPDDAQGLPTPGGKRP